MIPISGCIPQDIKIAPWHLIILGCPRVYERYGNVSVFIYPFLLTFLEYHSYIDCAEIS